MSRDSDKSQEDSDALSCASYLLMSISKETEAGGETDDSADFLDRSIQSGKAWADKYLARVNKAGPRITLKK